MAAEEKDKKEGKIGTFFKGNFFHPLGLGGIKVLHGVFCEVSVYAAVPPPFTPSSSPQPGTGEVEQWVQNRIIYSLLCFVPYIITSRAKEREEGGVPPVHPA